MNNYNGFITINRDLKNSNLDNNLELLGLFTYFALYSQYESKTIAFKGHDIDINKGQCLYLQKHLSDKFGLSIGKINKLINRLEKYGLCENKNTNKYSIIELLPDFIFIQSGKQNENKMKTKGNNIINNKNNNKNIYIDFENYFKDLTGKTETIINTPKISIDEFKISYLNYYKIFKSDLTYYDYFIGLNDFIKTIKHHQRFLNAKIDDFLDLKKKDDIKHLENKKTRETAIKIENKKHEEEEQKQNEKHQLIKDFIDNLDSEKKLDIENKVRIEILKLKLPIVTTAIFRAYFNNFVYKNYIKNNIDNIDK